MRALTLSFMCGWVLAANAPVVRVGLSSWVNVGGGPLYSGAPTDPTLPSVAGLHVSGADLLNGANEVIQLRGVNKAGTEYMCIGSANVFDGPTDANSITILQSWAINVVRLPINESCWLNINGVVMGGATYQNAVTAYVSALTAANIAVVIDLQWSGPGTQIANQLTPMPGDHASAFWTSVANTYKTNNSVIFDLFNEPWPDNNANTTTAWTCVRDGGNNAACPGMAIPSSGVTYTATGMQTMLDAVRATGSTNVVMVAGVQFTNILNNWLTYKPIDPLNQLMASWHTYQDQICITQAGCWDTQIAPVAAVVPVMTGEIGERDCQGIYIDPLMAWADTKNISYMGWAWNTYDCSSFPAVLSDYDGTPTDFGVVLRNHLLARAGLPPPPVPPIPMFSDVYPFGINVGSGSDYTATDGTIYHADVASSTLAINEQFFFPFTNAVPIAGTLDDTLYQSGKYGNFGIWTINIPNGTYVVTLGIATSSAHGPGEFGQDHNIQSAQVGTCIFSPHSGTNLSGGTSCPGNVTVFIPAVDTAYEVSYTISVYNQHLRIQSAASFGDGRYTVLNSIKVAQVP